MAAVIIYSDGWDDILTGSSSINSRWGADGDDTLSGMGGTDTLKAPTAMMLLPEVRQVIRSSLRQASDEARSLISRLAPAFWA